MKRDIFADSEEIHLDFADVKATITPSVVIKVFYEPHISERVAERYTTGKRSVTARHPLHLFHCGA